MAITNALMYARLSDNASTGTGLYKKARLAATRLNYYGPKLLLTVNGTVRHRNFDRDSWRVSAGTNGKAGTLSIEVFGFTPAENQEIIFGAGSLSHRLFRGTITRVAQVRGRLNEGRVVYRLTCTDWTYQAQSILITKRYVGESASAIATDLMTFAPAGFSSAKVQPGLDTIDEITFTMTPLPLALQQAADRIGAYQFIDYEKVANFYTTDGKTNPETLTSGNKHIRSLSYDSDIDELRNRILAEGLGGSTTAEVLAGFTTIPLTETDAFASSGTNYAKLDSQLITYTGKSALDGTGSTVSGIPQNPTAPSAAVVAGAVSGGVIGTVAYKVLFRKSTAGSDQSDDSETSAASSDVTISSVDAPSSAPSPTVSTTLSGDVPVGTFRYKVTHGTSLGETLASSATGGFTIPTISAPGAPGAAAASGTTGNVEVGSHLYKITFETSKGETVLGSFATATISAVSAPGSSCSAAVANASAGGNVGARTVAAVYNYKTTFVTAAGETLPHASSGSATINLVSAPGAPSGTGTSGGSLTTLTTYRYVVSYQTANGETEIGTTLTVTLTGAQNAVSLTSIPTSANGRVTKRRIWRTHPAFDNAWFFLVTTINDNTTTTYTDTTADSGLGEATSSADPNTTGYDQINLTSIPTSGDGRVTKRKIYRTEANGSTYKLLTTINDNSSTTYTDNTADSSLGDEVPAASTAGGGQINLTSIPTSADARVLRRKIYRAVTNEPSSSGTYYYLATLNDNSTTTYADNKADASLGEAYVDVATYGGGQIDLASIPTSANARVTKRVLYRTKAGGSVYYKLATIPDNSTTTFTDNKSDEQLVDAEPTEDKSGGGKMTVTIPVGPAGTTGRKLFRTESGGLVFKYLATINNNTTTTYTDAKEDADLGEDDPQESKVRTPAGATTLPVKDLSQFSGTGGWVRVGSQVISYTGRAASSGVGNLTGIPSSGIGSLTKQATYGTEITNEPFLTGIPASGEFAIAMDLAKGDSVNVLEIREDATSQATWGMTRSKHVADRRLTREGCQNLGDAMLALLKDPRIAGATKSTDLKLLPGRALVVNVTEWGLSATVTVQGISIQPGTDAAGTPWPQPMVEAQFASRSLDDINAQLRMVREQMARSA